MPQRTVSVRNILTGQRREPLSGEPIEVGARRTSTSDPAYVGLRDKIAAESGALPPPVLPASNPLQNINTKQIMKYLLIAGALVVAYFIYKKYKK